MPAQGGGGGGEGREEKGLTGVDNGAVTAGGWGV